MRNSIFIPLIPGSRLSPVLCHLLLKAALIPCFQLLHAAALLLDVGAFPRQHRLQRFLFGKAAQHRLLTVGKPCVAVDSVARLRLFRFRHFDRAVFHSPQAVAVIGDLVLQLPQLLRVCAVSLQQRLFHLCLCRAVQRVRQDLAVGNGRGIAGTALGLDTVAFLWYS